jgi:hypothetical protein
MPLAIDEIYVHQPVDEAAFPIRAATPQAPRDADLPQARLQPMSYHSMPVAVRQPAWSLRAPSRVRRHWSCCRSSC